jgi:hypothetical protein
MFDFEDADSEELGGAEAAADLEPAPGLASEPGDLVEPEELEAGEEPGPEASVPDPPPPPPERGSEPPGRARGRVHHPTEEWTPPHPDTGESHPIGQEEPEEEPQGPPSGAPLRPEGAAPPPPADSGPALYDFATDEGALDAGAEDAVSPPPGPDDEFEDLGPVTDEAELVDAPVSDDEEFDVAEPAPADDEPPAQPAPQGADDLLAESPEFIDEEGEDEDLWFEQGPPKDFDFEEEN